MNIFLQLVVSDRDQNSIRRCGLEPAGTLSREGGL